MKDLLLAILVIILLTSLSGCVRDDNHPVSDDGIEDNCPWLTSATSEIKKTYDDPSSYIGVSSNSLNNLIQLQTDVQCFTTGIKVQDVITLGVNQIVNINMPDETLIGSTLPVWGIVIGVFNYDENQFK